MALAVMFAGTLAILASSQARADGFVCGTEDRELAVQVYNFTQSSHGTRNASVMVLANPTLQRGNQLIARFSPLDESLTNQGALYIAHVGNAIAAGNRSGEYVAGTRLGGVRMITLNLNFNYSRPVKANTIVEGLLTFHKLNGQQIYKPVTCTRYLKRG